MAVSVSVGKIKKAVNSTQISGYAADVTASAVLKEPCDVRNPVFILKGSAGNYNYANWGDRYYWVDKVIPFPNGIIEVHCHLDPLGTYQSDIFNTKAWMSFNSLSANVEIDDPRMNPEIIERKWTTISNIFDSTPVPLSGGTVVLTVFEAGQGSSNQGVKVYALSYGDFKDLLQNLQSTLYDHAYDVSNTNARINGNLPNFTTPSDDANMLGAGLSVIGYDIYKGLTDIISQIGGMGSWRDNLIKAVYVPIPISEFSAESQGSKTIYLGYTACRQSGYIINPAIVKTKKTSGVIPWSSKVTDYHFIKNSKYTKMQAICCGGQYVDINTDLIRDKAATDKLYCYSAMDICSGDWSAVLTVGDGSNYTRLASFGGNVGIDITGLAGRGGLGAGMNYTMGGFKLAGSILSMGLSNGASSSIGETAASVGSGIASQFIQNSVGGTGSGIAGNGISSIFLNSNTGWNDISICSTTFYPSILDGISGGDYDSYCQKYGFPCNKFGTIGDNTGAFIKCEGAFVECKGNQQDQQFINSVLNSGILVES